ncbi:MAG: LytTR family transcriptional regulator [Bacteroidetes bacterium]|nr:MAG: LytTR family transcriptional regulator [Bacteroidota bacterium]
MKNRTVLHLVYWAVITLFLTLFFGSSWKSYTLAFYFSSFLLPIVIGTTYFFNGYLVPKYLFKGQYGRFALYFIYMLIISLYLEMLVSLGSFVLLADFNTSEINLKGISIFILGATLYLIVFATSFIRLVIQYKRVEVQVASLASEAERNHQPHIVIRADRKNHPVPFDQILYIESLNDYVKVVTLERELITRQRISTLQESLPTQFIRIHRSFLVNLNAVDSFSTTEVIVNGIQLPISRTYKGDALECLRERMD